MKISVCMIVKNEEKILRKCLSCVKKFADEIIIVDTGSLDRTKEIAKEFTPKIYDFSWCDDFSKARNFSFSKAQCDYVFWCDADDYIDRKNVAKIMELKKGKQFADIYMFKYAIAFDNEKKPTFEYYRERLLKRNANMVWKGFVHEVIVPFGKIEFCDIYIEHHNEKQKDTKRNLRIYEKHIKNGVKLDTRAQYYYSKELFFNGYYKKCIVALKKFLKMPNKFVPNIVDAVCTLSQCYLQTGQPLKSLKALFNLLQNYEPNAEICCEIAFVFLKLNNIEKAILFYKFALQCQPNVKRGDFIKTEFYYLIPLLQLTVLYDRLGNVEQSKYFHERCKREYPNDISVIHNDKYFSSKK